MIATQGFTAEEIAKAIRGRIEGDGGVVIVGGEAGMGKTRLVNALANAARRLGVMVIAGSCSEAELSLPYLPFLEAIGNYLATAEIGPLRERLGPASDELAQLFPQLGRPVSISGDASQAKMRLFESILMLLGDAASNRALLLILEDLLSGQIGGGGGRPGLATTRRLVRPVRP